MASLFDSFLSCGQHFLRRCYWRGGIAMMGRTPSLFSLLRIPTSLRYGLSTLGVAVSIGNSRESSLVYSHVDGVSCRMRWYWVCVCSSGGRTLAWFVGLLSPGPPLWLLLRLVSGGASWRSCHRGILVREYAAFWTCFGWPSEGIVYENLAAQFACGGLSVPRPPSTDTKNAPPETHTLLVEQYTRDPADRERFPGHVLQCNRLAERKRFRGARWGLLLSNDSFFASFWSKKHCL